MCVIAVRAGKGGVGKSTVAGTSAWPFAVPGSWTLTSRGPRCPCWWAWRTGLSGSRWLLLVIVGVPQGDHHLVLRAVLMACWQRSNSHSVIRHSDRGTQFTSYTYQKFLEARQITLSMSAVGHCGDNAPAEGFFGMLKRERVNRRRYLTVADARADVFAYIECFYNPRIQRRLNALKHQISTLTQPSAKTGRTPHAVYGHTFVRSDVVAPGQLPIACSRACPALWNAFHGRFYTKDRVPARGWQNRLAWS